MRISLKFQQVSVLAVAPRCVCSWEPHGSRMWFEGLALQVTGDKRRKTNCVCKLCSMILLGVSGRLPYTSVG